MKVRILGSFAVLSLVALPIVTGCGDARDVKVSGDVGAASGVESDKPVVVQVYEPKADAAEGADPVDSFDYVDSFSVKELGKFEETLPIEGDKIHVVALLDGNDNGKCDAGEAWGDADADVDADAATVKITIAAHTACPELPSAE